MLITIFQASAFIITYPVNNALAKFGDENGKAIAWEKAFIQLAKVWLLNAQLLIIV
jgi:Niemann-Pick C1 protein